MKKDTFLVHFVSTKDCFVRFTDYWIRILNDPNIAVSTLKMEYGDNNFAYLSWSSQPSNLSENNTVCINATYARILGLKNQEKVVISFFQHVTSLKNVTVVPVTQDDWEVLEENSNRIQYSMLDQIRIIWPSQQLLVWVSKSIHLSLRVAAVEPHCEYGQLEPFVTNVIVEFPVAETAFAATRRQQASSSCTTQDKPKNMNLERVTNSDALVRQQESQSIYATMCNLFNFFPMTKSQTKMPVNQKDGLAINNVIKEICQDQRRKVVFRIHQMDMPCCNKALLNQPHNMFITKDSLSRFGHDTESSRTGDLILKVTKIKPPTETPKHVLNKALSSTEELSKTKEKKYSTGMETVPSYAKLCVIKDALDTCNDSVSVLPINVRLNYAGVTQILQQRLDVRTGAKVCLEIVAAASKGSLNEIHLFPRKKVNDLPGLEMSFRSYLKDQTAVTSILINSDDVIPVHSSVGGEMTEVLVSLSPVELKYTVIDHDMAKKVRITPRYSSERVIKRPKTDAYSSMEDHLVYHGEVLAIFHKGVTAVKMGLCLHTPALDMKLNTAGISFHNVLILGKTGSGKSALADSICKTVSKPPFYVHYLHVDCKHFQGKRVETLQKLFSSWLDECIYYQPSVLLLDDIDVIAGVGSDVEHESSHYTRVAERITELLEDFQCSGSVVVIATALSHSRMNNLLVAPRGKHLFETVLEIPEPTKVDRLQLLEHILSHQPEILKSSISGLHLNDYANKMEGYVVQDIVDFIKKCVFECLKRSRSLQSAQPVALTDCDLSEALKNSVPLSLHGVDLYQNSSHTWEDVGGLAEVKQAVTEMLLWPSQYPEVFDKSPLRHQSGLLLYGAPGTGKTLLAGTVARECSLKFISVKGPELLSKYIGASEEAVRNIFQKAQSAKPCVLFFDEFDSLAPRRGHDSTGVTDRVVNQFLTQLDGVESLHGVWVIAATSRPDLLDPALLRPGRLDKAIHCPLPDEEDRLSILQALSHKLPLSDDVELQQIACATEYFTGADLQALLYTAHLMAVEGMLCVPDDAKPNLPDVLSPCNIEELSKPQVYSDKTQGDDSPAPSSSQQPVGAEPKERVLDDHKPYQPTSDIVVPPDSFSDAVTTQHLSGDIVEPQGSIGGADSPQQTVNGDSPTIITQNHLLAALKDTRPSLSHQERLKYQVIYDRFVRNRSRDTEVPPLPQRATLA